MNKLITLSKVLTHNGIHLATKICLVYVTIEMKEHIKINSLFVAQIQEFL